MSDFPTRTPESEPRVARAFFAHYFSAQILGRLAFTSALIGAAFGFTLAAVTGLIHPFLGAVLGAGVMAILFKVVLGRHVAAKHRELDEHHRDLARNREAETQRQIAEMKARKAKEERA